MENLADVTSLGSAPYIPAASDISDIMGHTQAPQMLNHQTSNGNNGNGNNGNNNASNGGGLMSHDLMGSMHHQQSHNINNIKQDYGLTPL